MTQENEDASRRLVEASAWRVHLAEIGGDSTAQFEAWLLADARNLEAWQRVEAPWDFFGEHAAAPELVAARGAALGSAGLGRRSRGRAAPWRMIAASGFLLLTAFSGGLYWWLQPADYQTALGERRMLTLADGSRLTLDSNSEVTVSYSLIGRDLKLLRGQARFEVVHDAARPFLVTAAGVVVRATGTDFDVDLPALGVVVTLLQGRVSVADAYHRVALNAGEQLTFAPDRPPFVVEASPGDVLAWLTGQVVFHNAPLSTVIDRLNRYEKAQFVLSDPKLGALRVSGTFNTGNAMAIADILTRYLAIHASYSDSGRIELRR